jgi:hypothetical protein
MRVQVPTNEVPAALGVPEKVITAGTTVKVSVKFTKRLAAFTDPALIPAALLPSLKLPPRVVPTCVNVTAWTPDGNHPFGVPVHAPARLLTTKLVVVETESLPAVTVTFTVNVPAVA